MDEIKIASLLFVFLYLQNTIQCFHLYEINNEPQSEFLLKLRNILKNEQSKNKIDYERELTVNDLDDDLIKLNENHKFKNQRNLTPVLVKRIVPHDYKSDYIEFDEKSKTIFRPLKRVHVKVPVSELENNDAPQSQPNKKDYIVIVIKNRDKPLKSSKESNSNRNGNNYDSLKAKDKIKKSYLRGFFDKSGEANDPLAPGKYPAFIQDDLLKNTEPPPKPRPEYPFWNYWTYQKTIHEDDCPKGLVFNGYFCVGLIQ